FRHSSPSQVLVVALWGMAVAFFVNGLVFTTAPRLAAVVTYLQISAVGPVLGSTLWLIATERFDPRAARFAFARMISVGTLGGLAGGLVAERVGAIWGVVAVL